MNKNRILIIFTEGETDEEFYKVLINKIRKKMKNNFDFSKIKYECIRGISKFTSKLINIYKKDYCKGKYSDYEKIVCLCYDLSLPLGKQKDAFIKDIFLKN